MGLLLLVNLWDSVAALTPVVHVGDVDVAAIHRLLQRVELDQG